VYEVFQDVMFSKGALRALQEASEAYLVSGLTSEGSSASSPVSSAQLLCQNPRLTTSDNQYPSSTVTVTNKWQDGTEANTPLTGFAGSSSDKTKTCHLFALCKSALAAAARYS
jgi:hypothetical protein